MSQAPFKTFRAQWWTEPHPCPDRTYLPAKEAQDKPAKTSRGREEKAPREHRAPAERRACPPDAAWHHLLALNPPVRPFREAQTREQEMPQKRNMLNSEQSTESTGLLTSIWRWFFRGASETSTWEISPEEKQKQQQRTWSQKYAETKQQRNEPDRLENKRGSVYILCDLFPSTLLEAIATWILLDGHWRSLLQSMLIAVAC